MVEVRARDWKASLAWHEAFLGQKAMMVDEPNEFALFDAPPARIAVKGGDCVPGSTTLVLETPRFEQTIVRLAAAGIIPVEPEKTSREGYRRVVFTDPDGQRVVLFHWLLKCGGT